MKNLKKAIFLAAVLLPMTGFAGQGGGYLWEKNNLAKPTHVQTSVAKKMGLTAHEYKRWLFDEAKLPADVNYKQPVRQASSVHNDHKASVYKRKIFGSNN